MTVPERQPVTGPVVLALGVLLLAACSGEGGKPGGGGGGSALPSLLGSAPATPTPTPTPPILRTYRCRRAAEFHVDPEEAAVQVDGVVIGTSDDWDDAGGGREYDFRGPGAHFVRLSLRGYRSVWVKVVVDPSAAEEVVEVELDLTKLRS